jgi:hypothetical protein
MSYTNYIGEGVDISSYTTTAPTTTSPKTAPTTTARR